TGTATSSSQSAISAGKLPARPQNRRRRKTPAARNRGPVQVFKTCTCPRFSDRRCVLFRAAFALPPPSLYGRPPRIPRDRRRSTEGTMEQIGEPLRGHLLGVGGNEPTETELTR